MEEHYFGEADQEPPDQGTTTPAVLSCAPGATQTFRAGLMQPPLTAPLAAVSGAVEKAVPAGRSAGARGYGGWLHKTHFPSASLKDWNDWRWQLANRITDAPTLAHVLRLTEDEQAALTWSMGALPFAVTPYYLGLVDPDDPANPLRRCVVPSTMEHLTTPGESIDPLGEDHDSPVPGLVHRYPDRVLFLATRFCSTYCRYCTRSRLVGGCGTAGDGDRRHWEAALDYIARTPRVRDVLLSGGDPLTLEESALDWLLSRLRRIPHVEMVRIGTKVPMVLPQRVTASLCRVLKRHHPLFISIHCAHPAELTPESRQACNRLADAGIPLGSQTVLLKGVNDDPAVLKKLFHGLLQVRVRPYYLYQCDPIRGSAHFRTSVDKGLEIMRSLRGHTTGYAVPTYVIDAPGGGGKIPVYPDSVVSRDDRGLRLKNYEELEFFYPDPRPADEPTTPGGVALQ